MRAIPLSLLAGLGLAPISFAAQAGADSWQTFQNGPLHLGGTPIKLEPSGMSLAWQQAVGTSALGMAVIENGEIVVTQDGGFDRGVFGIDRQTGSVDWSWNPTGGGVWIGHAALYDGKAYVQLEDNTDDYLVAFDAASGSIQLQHPLTDQGTLHYAPVLEDGVLYCNTGRTGGMAALDPNTGSEIWFADMELGDEWSPTVTEDVCYGWGTGRLVAIDRDTGTGLYDVEDFGAETAGVVGHTPIPDGAGNLFIVNGGRLVCHDQANGLIQWVLEDAFTDQVSPAPEGIYVLNGGSLELRAPEDGSLMNSFTPTAGALAKNIIVTPEHLIVATDAETHLLDRTTLNSVWDYPAGGWLSLGEGLLLIAEGSGQLTAISYARLPQALSAQPDRLDFFASAGEVVTVSGFGFDDGTTPSVDFGGIVPSLVTVIDDHTLECTLPVGEPGPAPLSVTNSIGSATSAGVFTFSPSVVASGDFQLGGQVRLSMRFDPDQQIVGIYDLGAARTSGVSVPPLEGKYWLNRFDILFELPMWPFDDAAELDFLIPNDPALQGQSIQLQIVVGSDPRSRQGAFSQLATIQIL